MPFPVEVTQDDPALPLWIARGTSSVRVRGGSLAAAGRRTDAQLRHPALIQQYCGRGLPRWKKATLAETGRTPVVVTQLGAWPCTGGGRTGTGDGFILMRALAVEARQNHWEPNCTGERVTICSVNTLTIRTDSEVERALESLTSDGLSRSEAARSAILEAERAHRRARLRAEAEDLRNDPDDVAASRELAAEMDAVRAW